MKKQRIRFFVVMGEVEKKIGAGETKFVGNLLQVICYSVVTRLPYSN